MGIISMKYTLDMRRSRKFRLFCFFFFDQRAVRTLHREAIGPDGSNCLTQWVQLLLVGGPYQNF